MRNNKRWIGVTALAAITAAALVTSVVVKNNSNKGPENIIEVTAQAADLGVTQVEVLKDGDNVTGYKVNVTAKGFGETPMELAVSFDAKAETVTGVEVISQSETDGIGGNVTKPEFLDQFKGVKLPVYFDGMVVAAETEAVPALANQIVMASALNDGTYVVKADEESNGYTYELALTVEGGMITNVTFDGVAADGSLKSEASKNGTYKMTEDGPIWADQAQAMCDYVVENQGISMLPINEDLKTDAIASVSIKVNDFAGLVEKAMAQASGQVAPAAALIDGTYECKAAEASNGYTYQVSLTVEGGKITNVTFDGVAEDGSLKSEASKNGTYKMTEDGPIWADQAQAMCDYVIENQGISMLPINEDLKTDAIASVSIKVNDFAELIETVMAQAAGEEMTGAADSTGSNEGTKVDQVSGATITSKAFMTALNNAQKYLLENVVGQ